MKGRDHLLLENVGEMAATTVLTVVHGGHEDTGTTGLVGALAAETLDLAITVDLVVLEHSKLGPKKLLIYLPLKFL